MSGRFQLGTELVEGHWNGDGETFTLTKPIYYKPAKSDAIQIPVGFHTDFASSWLGRWNFLGPRAAFSAAAVLHDWLYFEGLETRIAADRMFRDALKSLGVGKYDLFKAYWGVRLLGRGAWKNHRANDWQKTFGKQCPVPRTHPNTSPGEPLAEPPPDPTP